MADLANCRITFVQDLRRLVERWAAHDLCNRPPPILRSLGLSLPALAGPLRRPADGGIALASPAARPLALQAGRVRGRADLALRPARHPVPGPARPPRHRGYVAPLPGGPCPFRWGPR